MKIRAAINTVPRIGLLRFTPAPRDAEDVAVGARIKLPSGQEAIVEGYRGFRRDHRIRLVCRYTNPVNRAFDVVLMLPELVTVIEDK